MTPHRKRIIAYVLGIITLGFLALTALVLLFPPSIVDREFSEEIQEHQNPGLDVLMKFISMFGYMPLSMCMVLATAALFYLFKFKKESLFVLFTLGSGAISSGLKILIDRPRPTEDLVKIIEKANHNSFPSGHTLFYVVFFGFVVLLMYHLKQINRQLRYMVIVFCFFLVFSVPLSRIYLGAHWFTDVLGGFLIGLLYLSFLIIMYLRKPKKTEQTAESVVQ